MGFGGGAYTPDADVSIEDCLIAGNQAHGVGYEPISAVGGGLALRRGTITIHRSRIVRNLAGNAGDNGNAFVKAAGGGVIVDEADVLITESVIADNIAGNTGTLQSVNAAGGGLAVLEHTSTITLENVTVSGNRVGGVPGAESAQDSGAGGGLYNSASLTVRSSTIANNAAVGLASLIGGGIDTDDLGTLDLHNSIVADNSALSGPDVFGAVNTTFSLIENQSDTTFENLTSAIPGDPGLGLLEDNGGPTPTQAISDTSPAFNAGDPFDCPATDQRGVERPQGLGCDIGAFELVVTQSTLLETFDGLVNGGALQGDGPGKSADNRLNAMRNKLALIEELINGGDTETACEELASALRKTDGQPKPPDFVQGAGAADLAAAIQGAQSNSGCQ